MSYTFGGATGDDIVVNGSHTVGVNGGQSLFAGWWYPTTLTATRGYCSGGNTYGMEVAGTTSELLLKTDNTTDAQWTTTGAGITTNKWWFIAFLSAQTNSGPTTNFRVWVGDLDALNEISVAQTVAPVGNLTGNANRYIGNKGTGTLAFQGDVGWMSVISTNQEAIINPFGNSTNLSITDEVATLNLNRWVRPLWLGSPSLGFASYQAHSASFSVMHIPLRNGIAYEWSHDEANAVIRTATVNGATFTHNNPPRSPPENWPLQLPHVRRAA